MTTPEIWYSGGVEFDEALNGPHEGSQMLRYKVIVERHPDGYVAYPLGIKGVVVGQGDTYEQALSDLKSAIEFHIETFGSEVLEIEPPVLEAFVAEAVVEAR
jgi:predicted RNase H-like HicB family nuclease